MLVLKHFSVVLSIPSAALVLCLVSRPLVVSLSILVLVRVPQSSSRLLLPSPSSMFTRSSWRVLASSVRLFLPSPLFIDILWPSSRTVLPPSSVVLADLRRCPQRTEVQHRLRHLEQLALQRRQDLGRFLDGEEVDADVVAGTGGRLLCRWGGGVRPPLSSSAGGEGWSGRPYPPLPVGRDGQAAPILLCQWGGVVRPPLSSSAGGEGWSGRPYPPLPVGRGGGRPPLSSSAGGEGWSGRPYPPLPVGRGGQAAPILLCRWGGMVRPPLSSSAGGEGWSGRPYPPLPVGRGGQAAPILLCRWGGMVRPPLSSSAGGEGWSGRPYPRLPVGRGGQAAPILLCRWGGVVRPPLSFSIRRGGGSSGVVNCGVSCHTDTSITDTNEEM